MDSEITTFLSEIETSRGHIFLQTKLREKEDGYDVVVLDGSTFWEASITEGDMERLCETAKMDYTTYVKETFIALTKCDSAFECIFKPLDKSRGQLTWKKVPAQSIKFNLGSVDMKKSLTPSVILCSLLSDCISNTKNFNSHIRHLEADNERLSQERQNALKRLDKCVAAKEELEKDLYSKFVLVLNSKKARIRELEENGVSQSIGDVGATANPQPGPSRTQVAAPGDDKAGPSRRSKSPEDNGFSETAYDVDTDDETPTPRKTQSRTAVAAVLDSLDDSLLNFGEEDDAESRKGPVAKRPRRKISTKKETPAKPILPRVSSASAAKGDHLGSRKSSLRKSSSGKSNKSSDNVDPDDLMDDF